VVSYHGEQHVDDHLSPVANNGDKCPNPHNTLSQNVSPSSVSEVFQLQKGEDSIFVMWLAFAGMIISLTWLDPPVMFFIDLLPDSL